MPRPLVLHAVRRFAASRPEARRFAARAWLAAPLVRGSLVLVGFRSTLRWVEALGDLTRPRAEAERVGVAEGTALVRGVWRAHLVGGECLEQSIVQYLLHRRDGLPVRLVVGVKRGSDPTPSLAAHAWIEAGHEGGNADFVEIFTAGHEGGTA